MKSSLADTSPTNLDLWTKQFEEKSNYDAAVSTALWAALHTSGIFLLLWLITLAAWICTA